MEPNIRPVQPRPITVASASNFAAPLPRLVPTPVATEPEHVQVSDTAANFHSNGFAQVANGSRVGAVSPETFEQRRKQDGGRRIVDNYRFSNMGRAFANLQAKPSGPDVPRSGFIPPK